MVLGAPGKGFQNKSFVAPSDVVYMFAFNYFCRTRRRGYSIVGVRMDLFWKAGHLKTPVVGSVLKNICFPFPHQICFGRLIVSLGFPPPRKTFEHHWTKTKIQKKNKKTMVCVRNWKLKHYFDHQS